MEQPLIQNGKRIKIRPKNGRIRWLALALACLVLLGNEYVLDIPEALQKQIQDQLDINDIEYNLFYTLYSAPNIIMPLIGGILVDVIGIKFSLLLFASLGVLGQTIFTIGCFKSRYSILLLGRLVIGLGGECLQVSQNFIVGQWFKYQELQLALGVGIYVAKLGSALNNFASPAVYLWFNQINAPNILGVIICVLSVISGIILLSLQKKNKNEKRQSQVRETLQSDDTVEIDETFRFSDLKSFPNLFWILFIFAIVVEPTFLAFMNIGNYYLQTRFDFSVDDGGIYLAIPYLLAGILTPLIGIYSDRKGERTLILVISSIFLLAGNVIFYLISNDCKECQTVIVPFICFGVFYSSFTACFYAYIPTLVPDNVVGTAFGLLTSGLNIGQTIFPILVGSFLDKYDDDTKHIGLRKTSIGFSALALFGLFFSVLLQILDQNRRRKELNELSETIGQNETVVSLTPAKI